MMQLITTGKRRMDVTLLRRSLVVADFFTGKRADQIDD
jgi:hypothetical protein